MRKQHIYKIMVCFVFSLGGIWQHNSEQPVLCWYVAKKKRIKQSQSKTVITSSSQLLKPLEAGLSRRFEDLTSCRIIKDCAHPVSAGCD